MRSANPTCLLVVTCLTLVWLVLPADLRADTPPGTGARRPPNIVLAIADDWSWPHASILDDSVVKTPAFDRVAREGALFTQAYVSAPSCSPSRASLLTGQHFWRLKEGGILYSTLPAEFPVYPDLLERAGYHVGYAGKGWAPGRWETGGRERNPAGPKFKGLQAFLDARPAGKPFCFWFGSTRPHRHYRWRVGVENGLDPDHVTVPACLPDVAEVRIDLCDYYWNVQRFDREVAELLRVLEQSGELDNTVLVVTSDNGMPFPRCKSNLYDLGVRVPLAVRWPGKVAAGRVVHDMVSLNDLAPTFLEVAGVDVPAGMTGKSLHNILLTGKSGVVEAHRKCVFTGKERHASRGYPMRAVRTHEFLYVRNYAPDLLAGGETVADDAGNPPPWTLRGYGNPYGDIDGSPTKHFMMKHRDRSDVAPLFEKAFLQRPYEELYDLRCDPGQMISVADDPDYAAVLEEMRSLLSAELRATDDPRARGEGDRFDAYPYYWQDPRQK